MMKRVIPDLDTLRDWRVNRFAAAPVAGDLERIERQVARTGRRLGEFIDAWEQLIPADLRAESRVASIRASTVTVVAASSSVLYEIDRLLRDGLEAELRRRIKGTLARVKVTIGPLHDPAISAGNQRRNPVR